MEAEEGKTDISGMDPMEDPYRTQTAAQEGLPAETIGSLMAECGELAQQIQGEKDRLERYMLETGGASDASDRIQRNIDSLEDTLAEAEGRLQALFDEQEKEAFAPKKEVMNGPGNAVGRTSVKKRLAEKKEEAAMGKPHGKERKSPGMDMEK